MLTIDTSTESSRTIHHILLNAVAPRPIAIASTLSEDGIPNVSPFSYFNVFSANPPILIFSPLRRVRNNTTKDTLENVLATKEVVVAVATQDNIQQASLSSGEYDSTVNEFNKAGFTPIPSDNVSPFRIKESPVNFECKVKEVIALGDEGGAGNLVVCEILKIHIDESVLDENNGIDPLKINLVARCGGDWYNRVDQNSLFTITKPETNTGIGFDQLPSFIKESNILTGNDLASLATVGSIPNKEEIDYACDSNDHTVAKNLLEEGKIMEAWKVLLS